MAQAPAVRQRLGARIFLGALRRRRRRNAPLGAEKAIPRLQQLADGAIVSGLPRSVA
jgi:hypothetical protein